MYDEHTLDWGYGNMSKEVEQVKQRARTAFAKYMASERGSCCEVSEERIAAELETAEILDMDLYDDKSGVDYRKYLKKEIS